MANCGGVYLKCQFNYNKTGNYSTIAFKKHKLPSVAPYPLGNMMFSG